MIYLSLVVDTERLQEFIKELWEMKWKWWTEARLMWTEEQVTLKEDTQYTWSSPQRKFEDKLFKLINSTKRIVQAKHKSISLFPVQ